MAKSNLSPLYSQLTFDIHDGHVDHGGFKHDRLKQLIFQ